MTEHREYANQTPRICYRVQCKTSGSWKTMKIIYLQWSKWLENNKQVALSLTTSHERAQICLSQKKFISLHEAANVFF